MAWQQQWRKRHQQRNGVAYHGQQHGSAGGMSA